MKEISSRKKAQANRRNALRSTGPKTPEGKRAARWNALQHGLLARESVKQLFREALANLKEALELYFEPPQARRPPKVRMIEVEVGAG